MSHKYVPVHTDTPSGSSCNDSRHWCVWDKDKDQAITRECVGCGVEVQPRWGTQEEALMYIEKHLGGRG